MLPLPVHRGKSGINKNVEVWRNLGFWVEQLAYSGGGGVPRIMVGVLVAPQWVLNNLFIPHPLHTIKRICYSMANPKGMNDTTLVKWSSYCCAIIIIQAAMSSSEDKETNQSPWGYSHQSPRHLKCSLILSIKSSFFIYIIQLGWWSSYQNVSESR